MTQPTVLPEGRLTEEVVADYGNYVAGGFAPLPIALRKLRNASAWDVDGKQYIDMLSMFSVVNMGHNHPRIVAATTQALQEGAVINLPFMNPYYGKLAREIHEMFGYDRFVALTSGGEAVDAAMRIARKWGTLAKGIPAGDCYILTAESCYHGVTLSTQSTASRKPDYFGAWMPKTGSVGPSGHRVRYGVIEDLITVLEKDAGVIAALILEPIQGAAGIINPPDGYLKAAEALARKHNILFIMDEIQTGLGRTGYDLGCMKADVRPDLVILGKALSGGMYPLSGVMGNNAVMDILQPYEVGSTMAANPPGCAAALAALKVLREEGLSQRSKELGELLVKTIMDQKPPHIKEITGDGLFRAIILDIPPFKDSKQVKIHGRRLCSLLAQRGVLANATGSGDRIRICPPLTIEPELLIKGARRVAQALEDLDRYEGPLPGWPLA